MVIQYDTIQGERAKIVSCFNTASVLKKYTARSDLIATQQYGYIKHKGANKH